MWYFFFFKQKTAYEMRISDWSSDVCSSDLFWGGHQRRLSNSCTERSLKQAGALALERNGRVFRSLPLDPDCLQTNLAPVTCHTQHEQFDSFVEYTIAVYLQKRFLRKGDVRPFFGRQRSDERRVGKECVSTFSSRWSP